MNVFAIHLKIPAFLKEKEFFEKRSRMMISQILSSLFMPDHWLIFEGSEIRSLIRHQEINGVEQLDDVPNHE